MSPPESARSQQGMKIKILQVITDLEIGGSPTELTSLATALHRRGYEVVVCSLKARSRPSMADVLEAEGIRVVFLDASKFETPVVLYRLYLLLLDEQPDLVHSWLFHANLATRLVARRAGVQRVICGERAIDPHKSRPRVWADRLLVRRCDLVLVNADAVQQVLLRRERLPARQVQVVTTGVDLRSFRPSVENGSRLKAEWGWEDQEWIIGSVARVHPAKGHLDLLEAMTTVHNRLPQSRLLLVGDGPWRGRVERRVRQLGLDDVVRCLGIRLDIPAILSEIDVFVLSSLEEGMPGAVLQAMAMERPVVATAVGGVAEVVRPNVDGLLVSPRQPQQLAEAILSTARDPERARERARSGRRRAEEQFGMDLKVTDVEHVYGQVLGKSGGNPR